MAAAALHPIYPPRILAPNIPGNPFVSMSTPKPPNRCPTLMEAGALSVSLEDADAGTVDETAVR